MKNQGKLVGKTTWEDVGGQDSEMMTAFRGRAQWGGRGRHEYFTLFSKSRRKAKWTGGKKRAKARGKVDRDRFVLVKEKE